MDAYGMWVSALVWRAYGHHLICGIVVLQLARESCHCSMGWRYGMSDQLG